jgi:hypothetical protein
VEEEGVVPARAQVADAVRVGGVDLGELLRDHFHRGTVELQRDLGSW